MNVNDYVVYMARLEDLGAQVLDLVAEMRADPPAGWTPPSLAAAAQALGMPGTCAALVSITPDQVRDVLRLNDGDALQPAVDALLAMGVPREVVSAGVAAL